MGAQICICPWRDSKSPFRSMPERKTAQKVHVRPREDDRNVSHPRHQGQRSNQSCLERYRQLTTAWRHLLMSHSALETLMDCWHLVHIFARPSSHVNRQGLGQPWSWIYALLEGYPKVVFPQHNPQSLATPHLWVHSSQGATQPDLPAVSLLLMSTESTLRTILQQC